MSRPDRYETTDETCDCGGAIMRLEPAADTSDAPGDVCYFCDTCGRVDRYEDAEGDA